MPEWLDQTRAYADTGAYKKALGQLEKVQRVDGLGWVVAATPEQLEEAAKLATKIAQLTDGRLQRRARGIAERIEDRARQPEREREQAERSKAHSDYTERLNRIRTNVAAFALLITNEGEGVAGERDFASIATRIEAWRRALHPCYMAGYTPVNGLGLVPLIESEQVRLDELVREAVNEIVLAHATVVDNLRTLRAAVPACIGYAIVSDDIRLRELVSSLQRHAGRTVEMPSDLVMSTAVLDALETAEPPAVERDLFQFIARASFHVGIGAALEDVLDRSTPSIAKGEGRA